jgi:penicillin-binding protein 1A
MYNNTNTKKSGTNKKEKTERSKWIKPFWICYISLVVILVFIFTSISTGWFGFMPSFADLENPKTNVATEVYSYDGELLGKYYFENRSIATYHDLPKNLTQALIATEDARFYDHSGVDVKALFRVGFGVVLRSHKGGGSTITQQLAKNLFPRNPNDGTFKTILTKFKEWVVAARLERGYSKNEIISMYFNTVDFGNNSMGIKSAATTYFNKEPLNLTYEESALLVGMLKAPTKYSPTRNPRASLARRNTVLEQMEKYKFISEQKCDSLQQIPIDMSRFLVQSHTQGIATYFREYIRKYMTEWCLNNPKADGTFYDIYKDGLKIYTTIDSRMQKYAEEAAREHVCQYLQPLFFDHWKDKKNAPFSGITDEQTERILFSAMRQSKRYELLKDEGMTEKDIIAIFNKKTKMKLLTWNRGMIDTVMTPMDSIRYIKSFLQCGLMAMEPQTGYVKAYVGGVDYNYFQFDHVMLSRRQVGSTFKPYVYTVAMQHGDYTPCKMVPNIPVTFNLPEGGTYTPKNSGDYKNGQMVTLREALANSLNYVSAYLMKEFGPQAVIDLVRNMGITSPIPAVPSICLGACELTLYEQVGAINCFPNQGVFVEPIFITRIYDKEGNVIHTFTPETKEAIDPITTFKTVRLMQGVVDYGTSGRLRSQYRFTFPLAGKTGTTDNCSDGWFVGYTPVLTCGVWVGNEDRSVHFRTMTYGQGARLAMPVFALFMQKVYADSKLPYKKIVDEKKEGYDFQRPPAYTGDADGCNERISEPKPINFD